MMSNNRQYDKDFKIQVVKLAKEIGTEKATKGLNVPSNTLYGWVHKAKNGELDIGLGKRRLYGVFWFIRENSDSIDCL